MLLAVVLVCSMSFPAFAADENKEQDVTVKYIITVEGEYRAEIKNGTAAAEGVTVTGAPANAKTLVVVPIPSSVSEAYDWFSDCLEKIGNPLAAYEVYFLDANGNRISADGSSLEHYTSTIARIDKRIRMLFPNAKVVFALTTAVREELYLGKAKRRNSQIDEFNRAAIKTLEGTGTVFNDLFSITINIDPACCSDMTHFNNPAGAALLGGQVVATICRELDIPAKDVNIENFELEKYSKDNIGF